ncbi:hypothetical protein [Bradyrhizobium sp. sGM-13]|uniref:hypothetical protein n=1 Tax=Bradyrhizobium sp. sGM-13 TaxID=2831781 RepID=UPI001BCF65F9|nr:hypothetical protein [Bradyrhizobium sp. sGM-13]
MRIAQSKSKSPELSRYSASRQFYANTGTIGTAATIATAPVAAARAPIGGNEYAPRNGFVCPPGTWFRGDDGHRHVRQQISANRVQKRRLEAAFFMPRVRWSDS